MTQAATPKPSRPRSGVTSSARRGSTDGKAKRESKASGKPLNGRSAGHQAANGKSAPGHTPPGRAAGHGAGGARPIVVADAGAGRRRIVVGRSGVHGKGVFAARPIARGETVIEYRGEVISWDEALRRHPHDPTDPFHTFYFHLDDDRVIDGKVNGNAARWINHACDPNCEADDVDGRVFIKALRDLKPGDELFYDYRLVIDERHTAKLKKQYECRCGSPDCRGTMLAPKR